jgi:type III secretory pathway component EscV
VTGKFSLLMYVVLQIIFHSCKLFSKRKEKKKNKKKEKKKENKKEKKRKKKKKNKRGHKRKWIKPHAIIMT